MMTTLNRDCFALLAMTPLRTSLRGGTTKQSQTFRFVISTLLFLFFPFQAAFSQQLKVEGVTSLTADKQGNCYAVTGNGIAKYNSNLELQSRHTTSFGQIENVDALDPFKILAFCKNFLRVFLLDNKLSVLGNPVFLPDVNVLKPSAVCRSAENGLWVVDAYRQQLLYLDFTLNTTREAASLSTYTNHGEQPATYMVERNGKLLINFSGKNIAVFDKFGALLHLFSVNADKWFDLQGDTLYYLFDKKLLAQNIAAWSEAPRLIAEDVDYCAVTDNAIFTYQKNVIAKVFAK